MKKIIAFTLISFIGITMAKTAMACTIDSGLSIEELTETLTKLEKAIFAQKPDLEKDYDRVSLQWETINSKKEKLGIDGELCHITIEAKAHISASNENGSCSYPLTLTYRTFLQELIQIVWSKWPMCVTREPIDP